MGVRQCQNIVHMLVFKLRRTVPTIARGEKDNFKRIPWSCRWEGEYLVPKRVLFLSTRHREWVSPEDKELFILQEFTLRGIIVLGAVNPFSGALSTSITEKYNATTFREFLITISPMSGEVYMLPDNEKYHHANLLKEFLENNSPLCLNSFPLIYSWSQLHKEGTETRQVKGYSQPVFSKSSRLELVCYSLSFATNF